MSLSEQLSEFKNGFIEKVPKDVLSTIMNATEELATSGIIEAAPKVSEKLKSFELPNQSNEMRSLEELLKDGPVVLTFYRGGWCPYCNLELRAYQEALSGIKAEGASLVAITPELPDASLSTSEKNELQFEVLTDKDSNYAREIGLVFTLPETIRPIYENFGIHIEEHNGTGQFDLPLAATFVIKQDGTIASTFVDADYTKRQEPADVINVLKTIAS